MPLPTLVTKILGTRFTRELKHIRPLVDAIHEHEASLKDQSDEWLRGQTARFRQRIGDVTGELRADVERLKREKHDCADPDERDGIDRELMEREHALADATADVLDELLPEAFATVREACRRLVGTTVSVTGRELTWDMVPYDVQLIGGICLHRGKIAEMATGEGKTLVAVLALYLNALPGNGAHLVTVNNYLARRDSQWMGHVYTWLGLTVGCIDDTEPGTPERRGAYLNDITYGTNNEFGFDYLRDNMVFSLEQRVQRVHTYAIIDEVDSILIDEARTPLIISGPVGNEADTKYAEHNQAVIGLVRRQGEITNNKIAEAEKLWPTDQYASAVAAFQVQLGMPKHKRLLKYLQEQGAKKLVQRVELDYIADRKLPAKQQKLRDLEEELYFVLDEKGHSVHLTDKGVELLSPQDPTLFIVPDLSEEVLKIDRDEALSAHEKLERRAQLESDYAAKSEKLNIIHQLLRAHGLYEKDVEYVVQEGQIFIVDEFTGRILPGRRWSDGLHQAVEAKEGVQVKGETQTLATITIQNYFRMYAKLAGMTGTAETEEEEFYKIYGLEVMVIPTNRPVRRIDNHDRIYRTRREKYNAISDEVERQHGRGLPVLVGTVSVEVSETLSRMLKRRGLKHEVLNAKYHQREAEIVAMAGQPGAVTIATNMAGRGTDIKLGPGVTKCKVCGIKARQAPFGQTIDKPDLAWEEIERLGCMGDPPCGLQIIGTERHESRRIDRQLRGRSGRQGDPGRLDLLPLARRRPDAPVRVGPHRGADGPDGGRGRRGDHPSAGQPLHRGRPEADRAAELPVPQAAARVRRRHEPAARGDLLAAAVRPRGRRGVEGRGDPDGRGRAGAAGGRGRRREQAPGAVGPGHAARDAADEVPAHGARARPAGRRQPGRAVRPGQAARPRGVRAEGAGAGRVRPPVPGAQARRPGGEPGDAALAGREVEGPPVRPRPAPQRHHLPRLGPEGPAGRVQAGSLRDVRGPDGATSGPPSPSSSSRCRSPPVRRSRRSRRRPPPRTFTGPALRGPGEPSGRVGGASGLVEEDALSPRRPRPPPRATWWWAGTGSAGRRRWAPGGLGEDGAQRPVPLRLGEEVQEVPRRRIIEFRDRSAGLTRLW